MKFNSAIKTVLSCSTLLAAVSATTTAVADSERRTSAETDRNRYRSEIPTMSGPVPVRVRPWKTLKDAHVVKQALDFSCGAASLATLLNGHYAQNVTEADLLKAMDKGDGRASFADMARALPQFGFKAQGFAATWEQLTRLKVPVILYVKHRANDHFTVLRGIDADTVWLADPSLGNRTYSRAQFLKMWETRTGNVDGLAGKFLAVLPVNSQSPGESDFFSRTPIRQTKGAVSDLVHQSWRP